MTGRAELRPEDRDDRAAEYARLRKLNYTPQQAARRIRISERTGRRYEAAMKGTQ